MLGIIPSTSFPLLRLARLQYRKDLLYHNFPHAIETGIEVLALVDRCQQFDIPVDRDVVFPAAILHDAGMGMPGRGAFASDEEFAAHISGRILQELLVPVGVVTRVQQCILSSHRDASFEGNEAKILRAADLAGLRGPYALFLQKTLLLKRERELLTGKPCSWLQWKDATRQLIEFFLSQDIRLTPLHETEDGQSAFHVAARRNLDQFLCEPDELLEMLVV